jgi:hypothetical protein
MAPKHEVGPGCETSARVGHDFTHVHQHGALHRIKTYPIGRNTANSVLFKKPLDPLRAHVIDVKAMKALQLMPIDYKTQDGTMMRAAAATPSPNASLLDIARGIKALTKIPLGSSIVHTNTRTYNGSGRGLCGRVIECHGPAVRLTRRGCRTSRTQAGRREGPAQSLRLLACDTCITWLFRGRVRIRQKAILKQTQNQKESKP